MTSGPSKQWDGGPTLSANNNWTTAANWVGDVAPVAGDTLDSPTTPSTSTSIQVNVNDFPAGTSFKDIVFNFAYYDLVGNPIELTGNVVGNNGANANTISLDVVYDGGGSMSVPTGGAQLILAGATDVDGGTLSVSGGGFFSFSGDIVNGAVTFSGGGNGGFMDLTGVNKSFAGPLTIDGKYVQVGVTLTNAQVVLHGQQVPFQTGFLAGTGTVNGLDADSGTVLPGGQNTNGFLHSTNDVIMDGGSVFNADVNGIVPGTSHDQLDVLGTVTLGGTLSVTSTTPPLTGEAVIIKNDGVDDVMGGVRGTLRKVR